MNLPHLGTKRLVTKALPVLLGGVLLYYLFRNIGVAEVVTHIESLGWRALLILLISVLWKGVNTAAWALSFLPDYDRPSYWQLFRVNLAGDVVNNLLPTGNLGGEVAKPYLLTSDVDRTVATSAVVACKTMEILSGLALACAGVITSLFVLPLDSRVRLGLGVALLVAATIVFLIYHYQRRGPFATAISLLNRAGLLKRGLDRKAEAAGRVDTALSAFYDRSNRSRALAILGLRIVSWTLGTTETYFLMICMGADVTFLDAFLLVSLSLLIETAFLFVPAGVGTYEAGHTYLSYLLGINPAIGLATAVAKRGRKMFWMLMGLIALQGRFAKLLNRDEDTPDT